MGDRCAKESQDAIPRETGNRTLILVNRLDHVFKGIVDNLRPILRIEMLGCCRGAFHITKEHGDDPPFANHPTALARQFKF